MNSLPPRNYLDGRDAAPPAAMDLKAGPVTAVFQPETGYLRYLRVGDHEIVRGIYGAVRNPNWGTVRPILSNLSTNIERDSFEISFEVVCQQGPIDFHWTGRIVGETNGRIVYTFDGEARASFASNRTGLCVLHPITECVDRPCAIEHPDGTVDNMIFPKLIAPHQPFETIRKMSYEPAPGVTVTIDFQGEEFETEDQRNWTDASFKTYAPPLDRPFPITLKLGQRIAQSITVSLPGTPRRILPILFGRDPQLSISTTNILPRPPLGLQCAPYGRSLADQEMKWLRRLRLSHLRTDLVLSATSWRECLDRALEEAASIESHLHVACRVGENAADQLQSLQDYAAGKADRISLWIPLLESGAPMPEETFKLAQERLSRLNPQALFAAGSSGNFVDLNRNRLSSATTALPCYPINPQVHATDNWSLVESLAAQPQTVLSTRAFAPRSAVVSPITFKSDREPDPRQMSLFGAGWTLGSLANLAATGQLHSLTYFESVGCNGIMNATPSTDPIHPFSQLPGGVFPIYHLFADLVGFDRVCQTHSSHPLLVEGLTLTASKNKRRILVANLTENELEVRIKTGTCKASVRYLDESNVQTAMTDPETFLEEIGVTVESASAKIPLQLKPFALARVDIL